MRAQSHVGGTPTHRASGSAAGAAGRCRDDRCRLDNGVLRAELAEFRIRLTAITNSLSVARALGASEAITVLLCPGEFRMTEDAVFGPETLAFLDRYHADAAFFGAGGFSAEQVTDADAAGVWVKRKMMERSERACLLADHSKAGRVNSRWSVRQATRRTRDWPELEPALAGALASADVIVQLCPG